MSNSNFWIELRIVVFFVVLIAYRLMEGRKVVHDASKALDKERAAFVVLASETETGSEETTGTRGDTLVEQTLAAWRKTGVFNGDALVYPQKIARARYLAGIFVFIGLVGTVSGIALSLSSLGDVTGGGGVITANKLQSVMTSIGAVLGGMKVSAWCTLAGIVATWNLSGANSDYIVKADKLISDIEKHWITVLEPKRRRRERESEWLQNRLLLQDVLQNVMLTVIEKENEATRQANKELAETITAAQESQGKQLMQGMEFIAGALFDPADALRQTIIELKQEMVGTASWLSNAAQTAERVSGTLEAAHRQQRELIEALTNGAAAIGEQSDRLTLATGRALGELDSSLVRTVGSLQNGVEESLRGMSESQGRLDQTAATLLSSVTASAAANAATVGALAADREEREKDRETWEIEINAMLREQERARQAWAVERVEAMTAFGGEREVAFEALKDTLKEIKTALAAQQKEFHGALAVLQTESLREVRTMREAGDAVLTNTQNAVAAMQKDARTSVKLMTDATQAALTSASEETKRAQETSARFAIAADKTLDILEKAHDDQQARTETLIAGVQASETRLAQLFERFEQTLAATAQQAEQGVLRDTLQRFTTELTRSLNAHTSTVTALRETANRLKADSAVRSEGLNTVTMALNRVSDRLQALPETLHSAPPVPRHEPSPSLPAEVTA